MLSPTARKLLALSAGAIAATGLAATATPAFASGASVTQVTSYVMDPTSDAPIDVGTINSQFTTVTLTASGLTSFQKDTLAVSIGPDGGWGLCTPNCPDPDAQIGTLLYRVGTTGPWQSAGSGPTVVSSTTVGDVYVLYNDAAGTYGDNAGSLNVVATRVKPAS